MKKWKEDLIIKEYEVKKALERYKNIMSMLEE